MKQLSLLDELLGYPDALEAQYRAWEAAYVEYDRRRRQKLSPILTADYPTASSQNDKTL